jgi:PAS domain S-box-containing protein
MIFYNHLFENTQIIDILKEEIELNKKSKKLYFAIKDKLNNFKRFDLKEINFYLPNGDILLKSKYKGYKKSEKNIAHQLINKSKKDLKIASSISICDTSASLKYIRPLFDKQFNLLAFVEIAANMPKISFSINRDNDFQTLFIFKKDILKNRLDEQVFNSFKDFELDNRFMYEDSIYNKKFTNKISQDDLQVIQKNLYQNKKFAFRHQTNDFIRSFYFIPLKNSISNKKIGYIFAWRDEVEYASTLYSFLIVFLSIVFVVMAYFIHYYYLRYKISDSKFNNLYKGIDKHVIVAETDTEGIITYVSKAFCKVSGYKKEEIIGRPINMLRSPDISKKFFHSMWKTIIKGEVWEGEIKNIDKNGNSYWVRGNIFPIYDNDGKIIGYRSIRVNITDEKQLQKVNEILKRDLLLKLNEIKTRDNFKVDESKVKLMGQILDAFSNEWRKPISNISLILMDMENKINNLDIQKDEELNFIFKLTNEVNFLSKQLNDFKALFTQGNAQDKYNVYEVIKNVLASVSETDIKVILSGDETSETFGISFDFRKVILGIIYNSIEQIKLKNIKDGQIKIDVSKDGEYIIVKCQDNALGIPEEFIQKVFDADFSTKDGILRNGITLHMAKLLIKKSDGDMWVKNENQGCCFYIKLITKDRRKAER